jgi:hypothetical protein
MQLVFRTMYCTDWLQKATQDCCRDCDGIEGDCSVSSVLISLIISLLRANKRPMGLSMLGSCGSGRRAGYTDLSGASRGLQYSESFSPILAMYGSVLCSVHSLHQKHALIVVQYLPSYSVCHAMSFLREECHTHEKQCPMFNVRSNVLVLALLLGFGLPRSTQSSGKPVRLSDAAHLRMSSGHVYQAIKYLRGNACVLDY